MEKLVTAIVPAYNESLTIGPVVKELMQSPYFKEVIVISDGSTDNTARVAEAAGATVYQLPVKNGKGAAMQHGLAHAETEVVAFFDADLKGFKADHAERIVLPVLKGARVMNVGLRDRGGLITGLMHYLPLIGGERAMYRHVFEAIPDRYKQGFMIESALNYYCRSRKLTYGGVKLPGIKIVHKYEKVGYWRGFIEYVKMSLEIIKAMTIVRLDYLRGKF